MTLHIPFDNAYGRLPERFYTRMAPTPVKAPALVALNEPLARDLGLDPDLLKSPEGIEILSGNAIPKGADPLAQVYAGHQFGGWSPQLGDGRAILLGDLVAPDGRRFDVQLKGSGPTPYSRMGDGRAWLGPVLREYIVSEAMHALGVPTTRALAAVTTGEAVLREAPFPGAVLTRIAASHIRVGTFQFFHSRGDTEAVKTLADHVISRHYPEAETPLDLLEGVVARQARLVAQWLGLGFIHGVMNTDNMAVSGETIDYGPCAYMDAYHPDKVFSSIDQFGRYAYQRQPDIALWNLAQFATCLLPLLGDDRDLAVRQATEAVQRFADLIRVEWAQVFRAKLGLETAEDADEALAGGLLARMAEGRADFTNTFRALSEGGARDQFQDPAAFDQWQAEWCARLSREDADPAGRAAAMAQANPAVIPRNHRVEEVIEHAVSGDYVPLFALLDALSSPYEDRPEARPYRRAPLPDEAVTATFCGT